MNIIVQIWLWMYLTRPELYPYKYPFIGYLVELLRVVQGHDVAIEEIHVCII